uniref:Uncharacterized protein n=1 Tax=Rhipicephalus zambeziensis TaxID=60191 RepID=A0A224YID4_9ACAR
MNFLYTCKPLYAAALYIARLTTTITALSTYCRTVFVCLSPSPSLLIAICLAFLSSLFLDLLLTYIAAHFFHNCYVSVIFTGLSPFYSHTPVG